MADDAGFAFALTIRESLFNNALLAGYADGTFPRRLSTAVFPGGQLPGGPPDAALNVYLAPPTVTCDAADNRLVLAIEMWGRLSATIDGVAEAAQIDGHLALRIAPDFVVSGTNLVLSPPSDHVSVAAWSFSVIPPGHFSADATAYLSGPLFAQRLQATVQLGIALGIISLPPIDISFLNADPGTLQMDTAARVRTSAVVIGLSLRALDLMGNPDLLDDFAGPNDLAAATNKDALPVLLGDVLAEAADEVSSNGATLQSLTVTPGTGKLLVAGKASNSLGSANFSFSVIPSMFAYRPGAAFVYLKKPVYVKQRSWPALVFTIADVSVDVSLALWVDIVGGIAAVLNIGIPLILHDLANGIAAELTNTIAGSTSALPAPVPRVRRLPPASPGGPVMRVAMTDYEITPDGSTIGVTVTPEAPPGMLIGPVSIPADLAGEALSYTVRTPLGIVTDDPALRIRWTVIDLATGHPLLNDDGPASGRAAFSFTPATLGPGLALLGVTVRVYRVLGAQITDFLNDAIRLVIGPARRPGAYVRWYYDVKNPQVTFDGAAGAYAGEAVAKRHSNYHRTDKPCANEARRSRYTYQVETLDSLPFPVTDIALHRAELCDYCFYGGPSGERVAL